MRNSILLITLLLGSSFLGEATPVSFPVGYVPFAAIDYVTPPDSNGVTLVVGDTKTMGQLNQLCSYLQSLPTITDNQPYANGPIELAPSLFFSGVLIPTVPERQGNFGAFGGTLTDPWTGNPFPGNIIPYSRLGDPFAFAIALAATTTPEPANIGQIGIGMMALIWFGLRPTISQRRRPSD